MVIQLIQKVTTFKKKLSYLTNGLIVPIVENIPGRIGFNRIDTNLMVIKNVFVKEFWAKSTIASLQEIDPIIFSDADTESMRRLKMLNLEWKSPRKQLDLYLATEPYVWDSIGSISLLHMYGYKYRTYNIQELWSFNSPLEIGEYARIGIGTTSVGFGDLEENYNNPAESDKIIIYGNYTEEIALFVDNNVNRAIKEFLYPDPYKNPRVYEHVQVEPIDTWIINHNFNRNIAGLRIVSQAGDELTGTTRTVNANSIEVIFTIPYAGVATLI